MLAKWIGDRHPPRLLTSVRTPCLICLTGFASIRRLPRLGSSSRTSVTSLYLGTSALSASGPPMIRNTPEQSVLLTRFISSDPPPATPFPICCTSRAFLEKTLPRSAPFKLWQVLACPRFLQCLTLLATRTA